MNGVKIQPGKEIRVKKGDIVLCGDVDVTEQLPFPTPYPWIKWVAAVGVAAAVLLGQCGYWGVRLSILPNSDRLLFG